MADKTVSMSITIPESVYNALKDISFDLEASRSAVIAHCLDMQIPVLKQHPSLLKYSEFVQVTQQLSNTMKTS